MVKNLPTIERSTKIRFGKHASDDQAENTIVFNASDSVINAVNEGSIYMAPLRVAELEGSNLIGYYATTKEIVDSSVPTSLLGGVTLDSAALQGNVVSNSANNRVLTDTSTAGSINAEANLTFDGTTLVVANNIKIADGANIGSASDADAIAIAADGDVTLSQDLSVSGNVGITGTLTVNGTTTTVKTAATVAFDVQIALQDAVAAALETSWTRPVYDTTLPKAIVSIINA